MTEQTKGNVEHDRKCYLRFSLRWNKVHIHKSTIEVLKYPRYIQFLISKDKGTVYIRGCDAKQPDSFLVPDNLFSKADAGFYLCSKLFTNKIAETAGWDKAFAYRMEGKVIEEYGAVAFLLTDAAKL